MTSYFPKDDCEFCQASKENGLRLFKSIYGVEQVLRIPVLPQKFLLLQDLVPIGIEGAHLLLIPADEHLISFAQIADQGALAQSIKVVSSFLEKHFGDLPVCVFEHGPGEIDGQHIACGGCHFDHAHLHFVVLPAESKLEPIIGSMEKMLSAAGWADLAGSRIEVSNLIPPTDKLGRLPYLFAGLLIDERFSGFCYSQKKITENVESQLFRRILATSIFNHPEASWWHWRDISSGAAPERIEELKTMVANFRTKTGA